MTLSRRKYRSQSRNDDDFPTMQLFLLAIVRLAEPIALTSIFPYAWALVKRFDASAATLDSSSSGGGGGDDDDSASFRAGLLISAFSLCEAAVGMAWGAASDRVGRKPVLLMGCAGTMLSLLVVGFAPSMGVAVLGRALGGALNGNIGVIQTMVGELVTRKEHEPRAYSVMPFVWCIGTIVGPAVGGTFADPCLSWPTVFPPESSIFATFPYLLPNLICAGLLAVSIVLGYFLLDETHPDKRPPPRKVPSTTAAIDDDDDQTPLMMQAAIEPQTAAAPAPPSYGTFGTRGRGGGGDAGTAVPVALTTSEKPATNGGVGHSGAKPPTMFGRRIMALVLALSIFSFHCMAYDHLLPIFFEDATRRRPPASPAGGAAATPWGSLLSLVPFSSSSSSSATTTGGLGLSLRAVGSIMAVNGFIALFVQAAVFPPLAARVGAHRLLVSVTVLHPLSFLVVTLLPALADSSSSSSSPFLYPAIYACLALRNLLSILAYPLLLMLLKDAAAAAETTDAHSSSSSSTASSVQLLGKVNGLAASAGAACRMLAPPLAGWLYAAGSREGCTALAWYGAAAVAGAGAVQVFWIRRERKCGGGGAGEVEEGGRREGAGGFKGADVVVVQIVEVQDDDEDRE